MRACQMLVAFTLLLPAFLSAAETYRLESPGKAVRLSVTVGDTVGYELWFNGARVLNPSKLGLSFKDQQPFGPMRVLDADTRTVKDAWTFPFGRHTAYLDHAKELTLALQESGAPFRKLDLCLRVYDNGAAFRYTIPQQPGFETFVLTRENTEFAFTADHTAWAADYKSVNSSQEAAFTKRPLSSLATAAAIGCPLVVNLGDAGYAALSEADLFDWAGLYFASLDTATSAGQPITVTTRLSPRHDGEGLVKSAAPRTAPWRVILLGKTPADLVNNDMILNLSTPCQIQDTSWIKPGKSAWDWWSASNTTFNNATIREEIDFASEMGWPYAIIDDPWYAPKMNQPSNDVTVSHNAIDMEGCLRYAKTKNVRLILWMHWLDLERCGVERAFALYEKWGVGGVKIDFMDRDDQEMVNWYEKIVRIAAAHKLLVDFHGAYKPTGMNRTWPNQITREGVMGNEYSKWSKNITTEHTCTLPFTRLMLGPGDFTPGAFLNRQPETFDNESPAKVMATRAHELALCLVYDSPVLVLCDAPANYRGQPGLELLRELPTVWDESKALAGEIGQFYAMVRRSGDTWYFGAITDGQARDIPLPLNFLDPKASYTAESYADTAESASDATKLAIGTRPVSAGQTLTVRMVRNGGSVMVFKKR